MGAVSHGVRLLWMRLHGLQERTQDQGIFGQCSRRWRLATKCPEALRRATACRWRRHGDHAAKMKFKEDRPFATPETAERNLLELANAVEADHAGRLSSRSSTGNSEKLAAAMRNTVRR